MGRNAFCNKAEAIEVIASLTRWLKWRSLTVSKSDITTIIRILFDEGKSLLEHLLDNGTKCYSQLDCGWAMYGGMYPPYFIRKYRNRIISIHVKENSKVMGPGGTPASRHAPRKNMASAFANVKELPIEERQKILDGFTKRAAEGSSRFNVQCKMGAPESNIDWKEIKKALDEQDFEAFWVVEREGFYDEHDKCIAEDCAWIKANIQ